MAAKICRALGLLWLTLAAAVVALGYGSILYFEGWARLQETISPYNLWNDIALAITFGPGVLLLQFSDRLKRPSGAPHGQGNGQG